MTGRPTNAHMFESASKIVISGGSFIGSQHNIGAADDKADREPAIVYNTVSWNAILNSGGRADTVRCYPGTREAVMAQIEIWISAADHTGQPIFWLSGPAGAGKSAIAQSIGERCLARGIPMANFFFFRADATRNHAAPLVATLLCQLFELCPVIKSRIRDFVTQNFYIFDTSVEQQLKTLMLSALMHPGQVWTGRQKTVLILDGLDECASEKNSTQQDILRALHHIVTQKDSPFILLVSSRAEPHLTRSFNAIHAHVSRLYLDGDNFSPADDIRRFVQGEFREIKQTHHLAWTLDADWPSAANVESIVRKSSGHFIYAATIMRFLQSSPESPVLSLEKVEGIRPVENDDSPFAQLDAVYAHILAKARNWPKAREILAAQVLPDIQDATLPTSFWKGSTPLAGTSYILDALNYNLHEISSYTADLTALVKVDLGEVKFYHTSLGDFLLDKRRSGEFFIDLHEFRLKLVPALFYGVGGRMDNLSWTLVVEHFTRLETTSDALTEALLGSPLFLSGLAFNGTTLCAFLVKIRELYFATNADLYKSILKKWLNWFHSNHGTLQDDQLDGIQYATELWNQLSRPFAGSSKIADKEDSINGDDDTELPSDGSNSSLKHAAESAISQMLMQHMQSVKREHEFDDLPQEYATVRSHRGTFPRPLPRASERGHGSAIVDGTERWGGRSCSGSLRAGCWLGQCDCHGDSRQAWRSWGSSSWDRSSWDRSWDAPSYGWRKWDSSSWDSSSWDSSSESDASTYRGHVNTRDGWSSPFQRLEKDVDPDSMKKQLAQILQEPMPGELNPGQRVPEHQVNIPPEPEPEAHQHQASPLHREEMSLKQEARQDELRRQEEENRKRKEMERLREEELDRRQEEAMVKRRVEELNRRDADLKRREEELKRRDNDLKRREDGLQRREEELSFRDADSELQEHGEHQPEVHDEEDNLHHANSAHISPAPQHDVEDIQPNPQDASPLIRTETTALSASQELQEVFSRSITFASAQELLAIRAEAEAAAAEVANVRASLFTARMDLEAAFNEARSVRADSMREVNIARNDVLDAQAEVVRACAERDAVYAEVQAARDKAKMLQEQIPSLGATSEDATSRWWLPDWNFL